MKNYFLSIWIANLGVVPLFSFAFFLSLPRDFVLFFLLILVCFVRDPILYSLKLSHQLNFRRYLLPLLLFSVKTFSAEISHKDAQQNFFIAKGEQIQLTIPPISSFSVGNKEVLSHKYSAKSNTLLIKGKSLGYSDIVVWLKNKSQIKYQFYVTSKRSHLKRMELLTTVQDNKNFTVFNQGKLTSITGTIKNLRDYQAIKYIESQLTKNIYFDVTLDQDFRNKIYEKVYQNLLSQGAHYVKCQNTALLIKCTFLAEDAQLNLTQLKTKYFVHFESTLKLLQESNLRLKFNIFSLSQTKGSASSSGFNKVQAELKDLVLSNRLNLETDQIHIRNSNFEAKLIAMPKIQTRLDSKFKLELGTDIPWQSKDDENKAIEWRFAGLKIAGILTQSKNKTILNYQTELSAPSDNGISGPKSNASLNLKLNTPITAFTIDLNSNSQIDDGLPILSKIPVLKYLFTRKSDSQMAKMIICIVTLTKGE